MFKKRQETLKYLMQRIVLTFITCCLAYGLVLSAIDFYGRWFDANMSSYSKLENNNKILMGFVFYDDNEEQRYERLLRSVALFQKGHVAHLVMVGGWRPERNGYHGAQNMVSKAHQMGVPLEQLHADQGSNDTISNLEQGMQIAGVLKADHIVFISDRLHLARIALLTRKTCHIMACSFSSSPLVLSPIAYLARLHHELTAYASLLLPRKVVEMWLSWRRQALMHHNDESAA